MSDHHYIGDGVYVEFADQGIILRTGSHDAADRIVLEPDTWSALLTMVAAHKGRRCGCVQCEAGVCSAHGGER